MKTLLVFSLLVSMNISAKAVVSDPAAPCADCSPTLSGTPAKGIDKDLRKIASSAPSENIGSLASAICMQYRMDGNKIASNLKTMITDHIIRYEGISNPTTGQIIQFLNHNKNFMNCASGKNYMMESFDHGRAYDQLFNVLFFDELLSEDESLYVDVNAISEGPDGNPETVLDYMYRRYSDPTHSKQKRDEIKSLIETFEDYLGAKRYANLDNSKKDDLFAKR